MNAQRILIIDDTAANIRALTDTLEPLGYEILVASGGDAGMRVAARALPDLILLDVMMPGRNGFDVCRRLKESNVTREVPVLFITAKTEADSVVKGFASGAVDYIRKPFHREEVVSRVQTHLRLNGLTRELQRKNEELAAQIAQRQAAEVAKKTSDERLSSLTARDAQRWGLPGFIGRSPHLRRILSDIERLQNFGRTTVLVTGESGTGKELIARALHHHSPRASGPFIAVNCVAIPAELAESLLFGHVKGAFTGALSDRQGYFELADRGTLFLDEVGDMPAPLQAKLLRVLEDGEVTPVGSTQPRRVDARVIAATNADLPEKIAAGEFRQDLYFRLARYHVQTPPLRERREDIPVLAAHFLELFSSEMGREAPPITLEALEALGHHSFPGNVRELKNVIERALIISAGAPIEPEHLHLLEPSMPPLRQPEPANRSAAGSAIPLNLESAEHVLIQRALEQTGGNVAEAARLLGVNRSRIYRRMPSAPSPV